MIITSHRQSDPSKLLLNYLHQKIGLSENAINLGIRHAELEQAPLPVVLWSYGLLSLSQYQEVLDWQRLNK